MNRDNASKETKADGRMMIDEGWQKTRGASLCPSSGLPRHRVMQAHYHSGYAPATKLKWINT